MASLEEIFEKGDGHPHPVVVGQGQAQTQPFPACPHGEEGDYTIGRSTPVICANVACRETGVMCRRPPIGSLSIRMHMRLRLSTLLGPEFQIGQIGCFSTEVLGRFWTSISKI
jgi:hypothetical protein